MDATVKKDSVLDVLYRILSGIRDGWKNSSAVKKLRLDRGEVIYCIYFGIVFFYYYLKTTTIVIPMDVHIAIHGCVGLLYIAAWFKMAIIDIEDKWDIVRYLIPVALGYIVFQTAESIGGWNDIVLYYFLIVSARKVSFRKIAMTALVIGTAVTVIVTALSPTGLYTNLIYSTSKPTRYAFGFIYPTDYSAHICFLALLFFWIRGGKMQLLDIIIYLAAAAYIFIFCYGKTDTVCIIMIVIFGLMFRSQKMTGTLKKCGWVSVWAIPVLAAVTIALTVFFVRNSALYQFMYEHMSSVFFRFQSGNIVMNEHGLSIFGKMFDENGLGLLTDEQVLKVSEFDLTFIDISYVKILMRMGIASLAAVVIFIPGFIHGRLIRNDLVTVAVWFIIAINCAFAHHFVDLSYNVFLFMLFADLSDSHLNISKT